jgi:hypothetical protein
MGRLSGLCAEVQPTGGCPRNEGAASAPQPHNPVFPAGGIDQTDLVKPASPSAWSKSAPRELPHISSANRVRRGKRRSVKVWRPPIAGGFFQALPVGVGTGGNRRAPGSARRPLRRPLRRPRPWVCRHAEHERAARLEELISAREGALHGWGHVLEDIRGEQKVQRPLQRRIGPRDYPTAARHRGRCWHNRASPPAQGVAAPIRQPHPANYRGEWGNPAAPGSRPRAPGRARGSSPGSAPSNRR